LFARYLIPLVIVLAGLVHHIVNMDRTIYPARIDARIFAIECQASGRNTSGRVAYAFVANNKAYEGRYVDPDCRGREAGQVITVQYVPDAPEKNAPVVPGQLGITGAMIWALIAYAGIIAAGWLIVPPRLKPWRKAVRSRPRPKW
jgi:hypothetical protein